MRSGAMLAMGPRLPQPQLPSWMGSRHVPHFLQVSLAPNTALVVGAQAVTASLAHRAAHFANDHTPPLS